MFLFNGLFFRFQVQAVTFREGISPFISGLVSHLVVPFGYPPFAKFLSDRLRNCRVRIRGVAVVTLPLMSVGFMSLLGGF